MEICRIVIGLFLFILPGYFLSLLLFKKINFIERTLFGFASGIFIFSILLIIFASFIKVTSTLFYALYLIYLVLTLFIFLLKVKEIDFHVPKELVIKAAILSAILVFAFYMTFFPHLKYDYYLPFHADEWVHWGLTRAFMENGRTSFVNPFNGNGRFFDVELGFHVFLSSLKWLSGADFRSIFVLMPSIISMFVSMAAFCIGERSEMKFGLAAAFMTPFIPTTIRYLGPSFLVPVATGLLLVLFSIWLLEMEGKAKYILFSLTLFFSIFMHLPTAAALAVVAISHAALDMLDKKFKEGAIIMAIVVLPFLIIYFISPDFMHYLQLGLDALFEKPENTLPIIHFSFDELTKIIWGLFFISVPLIILKGKRIERKILLSFVFFFTIFFLYQKYKFGIQILGDRFILFTYLAVTTLAGYGIFVVARYSKYVLKYVNIKYKHAERIFMAGIIAILLILTSIYVTPVHKNISFYRSIGERDYENFIWIRENIGKYRDENHSFDRAAIFPFKAGVFSAVTGIYTLASSGWPRYGGNLIDKVSTFMENGCVDNDFLEKYEISIIYGMCKNPYAKKIHDKTYLFYGVPPSANFYTNISTPCKGQKIDFISNSTSPYSNITKVLWDFGDGNTSYGSSYALRFDKGDVMKTEAKMNGSFTIEMWLNPFFPYDDGITHRWFFWGDKDGYVSCFKHSNGRIYFVVKVTKWRAAYAKIKYEENKWHHFAASYNNGVFHLYWDGKLIKTVQGGNILPSLKKKLIIGGTFEGYMKDIRLYNRALTANEIKQNYLGDVTMKGMIAWWSFNEGYGSIAHDSIGSYNATLYGCQWMHHAVHSYKEAGTYDVTLTVWNEKGLKDEITKEVVVKDC